MHEGSLLPRDTVFAFFINEGRWREMGPLNTPRSRHSACVLNGYIYVVGGRDEKG